MLETNSRSQNVGKKSVEWANTEELFVYGVKNVLKYIFLKHLDEQFAAIFKKTKGTLPLYNLTTYL